MSPSHINTKPVRTSSEASTSSTVSSPTSLASRSSTFSDSPASGGKFFDRIRAPHSRSPVPSPTTTGVKRASTDSSRSMRCEAAPARPRAQKRNSGTTMQVGRHANDWLFGGFSFTEAFKDILRNDSGRN